MTADSSFRMWPWVFAKLSPTARWTARMTASASPANDCPACRAVTVPVRMRTPMRNMYSSPNMRIRSSKSSSLRDCASAASKRRASSASSGKAPKKLGSTSASITCGWRAKVSPSRGAVPRTSAISAMRSGFCLRSDSRRAAPCRLARKWSNSTSVAPGLSVRAIWSRSAGNKAWRCSCAASPRKERWLPFDQSRTMLDASSGALKPSSDKRSSVLWSSASRGNAIAGRSDCGSFSNNRA